jgi:flagellar motility protein MotE (MotC chaperone)
MKMLQSPVVAAIIGGILFLVTSAVLTTKGIPPMVHASEHAEAAPEPVVNGPSWDFFNPEMDQIIDELKTERTAIAAKEKQLAELAARLKAEKAELDDEVKKIRAMQAKVDRDVTNIKEDEADNLKKLAKMYASMEPAGAARILRELDDVVVVKILKLMKETEKGLVLDAFARIGTDETKRAAMLSEALRATSAKTTPAK